jgi:hypothetical protein
MGRGGALFIAAVLILAGCKSTDTKPNDKDPLGTAASRTKSNDNKGQWWDSSGDAKPPAAATDAPAARDPAAADAVSGKVVDPYNRPVRGVFISVEAVNPPPGAPAAVGIYTDQTGAFFTRGLIPGRTYNLTADTSLDGRRYMGSVQTGIPKQGLTIVLRDDLAPPGASRNPAAGALPPPTGLEPASDRIPPIGFAPPAPRPTDGSWAPGLDANKPVPATITPPASRQPSNGAPPGAIPPPDDLLAPPKPPVRPENIAEGPRNPWTPPPVSLPGPPSLPPTYPNPVAPPPAPPAPPVFSMPANPTLSTPASPNGFILLDSLGRTWEFPGNKSGSVVLVEFMTTDSVQCLSVVSVLGDFQSRYGSAGLQVIAVACDERLTQKQRLDAAGKFSRDNNLNYQVLIEPGDVSGGVRNRYNVTGYPNVVLLDSAGAVLWQGHPNKRADLESAIKRALGSNLARP